MKKLVFIMIALLFSSLCYGASGIFQTYIVYDLDSGGNTFKAGGINSDGADSYDGTDLGTPTSLILNGGEVKTYKNGGSDVTGAEIYYNIYLQGGSPGIFTAINLPWVENLPTTGDQKWQESSANIDILDGLAAGDYYLEVYWKVTSTDGDHYDTNGGSNFKASFTVSEPLPIELSSFYVEVVREGVKVHWATEIELNNAGFNLYKNNDLIDFIPGNGTTNEPHQYTYVDESVELGKLYTYKIADVEEGTNAVTFHGEVSVIAGQGMVTPNGNTPEKFALHENYPNPFNPETTIKLDIPQAEIITLSIFDATGKLIKIFVDNELLSANSYLFIWDGTDESGQSVSSGVYYYQIQSEHYSESKQMILMK